MARCRLARDESRVSGRLMLRLLPARDDEGMLASVLPLVRGLGLREREVPVEEEEE